MRKLATVAGVFAVAALVLGGCGTYRAERQGKQVGDAICNLKGSSSGDIQRAADKVQREMNDLQRWVGRPVQEDASDIRENLSDLRTHVLDGNDALVRQDIAVIQRNFEAVARTLSGRGKAAYDGIQEGLGGCN